MTTTEDMTRELLSDALGEMWEVGDRDKDVLLSDLVDYVINSLNEDFGAPTNYTHDQFNNLLERLKYEN